MAERMDHEAMRRAAELPLQGPAATDTLAASGGLELPGGEPYPTDAPHRGEDREPIPGEHDHTSEPTTTPAVAGTTGFGGDLPHTDVDPTLDAEAREQFRWEGGGHISRKAGERRSRGAEHEE
ncbi:MAG: hypothetical protein ACRD26_08530 [Vicinamibacterales bacterium]